MDYTTYEIFSEEYGGSHVLDLSPYPVDRTQAEHTRLWNIKEEARENFKVTTLGHRIFFDNDEDREKFITLMLLKWS
jgi:hypothetical protein